MLDVKQIVICDDTDCACCAMEAKIMEGLGDLSNLGDDGVIAERTVALSHAVALVLYGHYRAHGELDDLQHIARGIKFFNTAIMRSMALLRNRDKEVH